MPSVSKWTAFNSLNPYPLNATLILGSLSQNLGPDKNNGWPRLICIIISHYVASCERVASKAGNNERHQMLLNFKRSISLTEFYFIHGNSSRITPIFSSFGILLPNLETNVRVELMVCKEQWTTESLIVPTKLWKEENLYLSSAYRFKWDHCLKWNGWYCKYALSGTALKIYYCNPSLFSYLVRISWLLNVLWLSLSFYTLARKIRFFLSEAFTSRISKEFTVMKTDKPNLSI